MRVLLIVFLCQIAITANASPRLKVITTLPDLAEVVRRVGGDKVEVESLLVGTEDAHFMDAVPSFIAKVARADIVCVVGLDLEVGWIPKILSKSGNAKVQPGGSGYCETGKSVSALEKHTGPVDRSMGDVHPGGNPHFNLSPKALSEGAKTVFEALSRTRPEFSEDFQRGYKQFQEQMFSLHAAIEKKLKPLQSQNQPLIIEYHKDFSYFFEAYKIKSFGAIEEKPGVPPSAARLATVSAGAKTAQVRLAVGALYSPEKHLRRFAELSGIAYRKLPTMVQTRNAQFNSIEKLQHAIADAIVEIP